MRKSIFCLLIAAACVAGRGENFLKRAVCSGDECGVEESADQGSNAEIFRIVSPVGEGSVKPVVQAPRLSTLDGKRIAIVGGSFMANVTHPELKKLILAEYPAAKVYILNEVGSAGVFPRPGVRRKSVEDFQQKLRELEIDAVISGNGGCGLCTPKETGSSLAAEYIGIPAVTIAGPGFADQVKITSFNNGVVKPRVAVYPGAFASDSRETLIDNTDRILWPQIKKALTKPLGEGDEVKSSMIAAADPRESVFEGTLDEVRRYIDDMGWSDGLPAVPPTMDRIAEFLKFGGVDYSTPVAVLPIAHRNTLAIHVAANGMMAGCRPEFMPILMAIAKGLGSPDFRRTLASTHAWNPFCWLNGPLARQLGVDCGQGEISESANAEIGRFINLALKNLSGYYVKQDRMGTFGYLMPWCLAEDEAGCVEAGWQPYQVRKGYDINDNTITLASALMWGNNMAPSTLDADRIADLMAWDITQRCQFALGSGKQFTYRTVLLTEPVAHILAGKYKSPDTLEKTLIQKARRPLYERTFANYYANPGSRVDESNVSPERYQTRIARTEGAELTDIPDWYALPDGCRSKKMETIPTIKQGMTEFIVTGDRARNKVQIMPGGGFSTIRVELPKNWNELMVAEGYRPIEDFFL